jgi:3-methyladenine DNA glycosylase AlkC
MIDGPMAEPFKNWIDEALVRVAARHLQRVHAAFPARRFVQQATAGLDALELKQRVRHLAACLADALPEDFAAAASVLERSLAPPRADTEVGKLAATDEGLAGWIVWPMTEYVASAGLDQPQRALQALHALTQRSTAEFAIRPFLVAHEQLTLRTLHGWTRDPSVHVRRLVSEGSRPRLPWGLQLQRFVADPSPTLPLLEALQDDPSEYVRRSVANHLNDIAKDHPDVVAAWLEQHLPTASAARRALLKHASRTLIKRGDRRVLAAWGFDAPLRGEATLAIAPARVRLGGRMTVQATLRSTSRRAQRLVVDYVVHHVRANGATSPKVWKGWSLELAPGEQRTLQKSHSWQPTTIRTDRPGRHAVDLSVNGRVVAHAAFDLLA